jgi:hypothetical protein
MAFDIAGIKKELQAAPPASDLPWEVGVAIVSDTFRLAGLVPPAARAWDAWRRKWPRAAEQVAGLAEALVSSSLRDETVRALEVGKPAAKDVLEGLLGLAAPLTGEMIRENPFRQEEFLRYWIAECGGEIEGESEEQSEARRAQLDYRQSLAEYKKAEEARKAEAARRAQLLREAKQRAEQAKGWRE